MVGSRPPYVNRAVDEAPCGGDDAGKVLTGLEGSRRSILFRDLWVESELVSAMMADMFEGLAGAIDEVEVPVSGDAIACARRLVDRLEAKVAEAEAEYSKAGPRRDRRLSEHGRVHPPFVSDHPARIAPTRSPGRPVGGVARAGCGVARWSGHRRAGRVGFRDRARSACRSILGEPGRDDRDHRAAHRSSPPGWCCVTPRPPPMRSRSVKRPKRGSRRGRSCPSAASPRPVPSTTNWW